MAFIKKYYKINGNSILESVIALSIISVCLYIAVLVYSSVFSPKTAPKFYVTSNKLDELFFLMQIKDDSISNIDNNGLIIEDEYINTHLKHVTVTYKDSIKNSFKKEYYINLENE